MMTVEITGDERLVFGTDPIQVTVESITGTPVQVVVSSSVIEIETGESSSGSTPIVVTVSQAGERGPQGIQGIQGPPGNDGYIPPKGPAFTYSAGRLSRIDYDDGSYKVFTYGVNGLSQIDFTVGAVTTRKTFNYAAGVLSSIDETNI